jgi:hypothetical protein
MKISIDINHPAHVHLFRNLILELQKHGHEIIITATDKDVVYRLLEKYHLDFIPVDTFESSFFKKFININKSSLQMYKKLSSHKPDIFIAHGSIRAAIVSKLMGKKSIIFDDDEYTYPYYRYLCTSICGFSGFKKESDKIIKVNSFKELAYLHPKYFKPNPSVLDKIGISKNEEFILVRFVGWDAFHDLGHKGFDLDDKKFLLQKLEDYSNVFISSESSLPPFFEKYKLSSPPEEIHNLIHYSKLLVCDSQTMTTEAAVLGTPAIRCNTFVGKGDMLNFIELENRYKMIFNFIDPNNAINKACELLSDDKLKSKFQAHREELLKEKVNLTPFMLWLIENYPDSIIELKKDAELQYQFT